MSPFFLDADAGRTGQRFCVLHEPEGTPEALVVQLHAWAEEMNKCRRMAALQAQAWARQGAAVLTLDLLGCGDSSGDFVDANWDEWLADGEQAARWLAARWSAPLWWWGTRAGALLACGLARQHPQSHLVLWQPAASGQSVLQNFLRMKAAASLSDAEGGARQVIAGLKEELAAGRPVNIGGYQMGAALAMGLAAATLDAGPGTSRQMSLFEVASRPDPTVLPASVTAVKRHVDQGWNAVARAVQGPQFWQTTEIEDAPALLEAGSRFFDSPRPHA